MLTREKILIGSDINGSDLKVMLTEYLASHGYDATAVEDIDYYFDSAERICRAIQNEDYDRGILISATGQEMNIVANKFKGIRSAICHNSFTAKLSRVDTNTNVLCIASWQQSEEAITKIVKVWLDEQYFENNLSCLNRIKGFEDVKK